MEFFNFGARREYRSFVASQTCDFLLVDNGETCFRLFYVCCFALYLIVNEWKDGGGVENLCALLVQELGRGMRPENLVRYCIRPRLPSVTANITG
jgi:hypothetical protein